MASSHVDLRKSFLWKWFSSSTSSLKDGEFPIVDDDHEMPQSCLGDVDALVGRGGGVQGSSSMIILFESDEVTWFKSGGAVTVERWLSPLLLLDSACELRILWRNDLSDCCLGVDSVSSTSPIVMIIAWYWLACFMGSLWLTCEWLVAAFIVACGVGLCSVFISSRSSKWVKCDLGLKLWKVRT